MKKLVSVLKNAKTKTAAVATAALASGSAMAADPVSVADSLNAAITSGQSNYTIVVIGAIGLAAIGFGMGMIISAMRK